MTTLADELFIGAGTALKLAADNNSEVQEIFKAIREAAGRGKIRIAHKGLGANSDARSIMEDLGYFVGTSETDTVIKW